jgi:hypothetical protein
LIGSHRGTGAIGVAVGVLTELRIPCPVPLVLNAPALPDQSQQCVWVVRRLVMNRWQATARCPFLVLVAVVSSAIQALPGQFVLMCSGASYALSSQRV